MKDTAADFSHQGILASISETQQPSKGEFFQICPYVSVFKCSHQARASHYPDGERRSSDRLGAATKSCVCNPGRCVNTAGRPPIYNLCSFWSLLHWLLYLQGHLGNSPVHAWRKDFDLIYRAVFHPVATAALNIHDLWDGLASERACYFHWWFTRVFSRQAHMYINIK